MAQESSNCWHLSVHERVLTWNTRIVQAIVYCRLAHVSISLIRVPRTALKLLDTVYTCAANRDDQSEEPFPFFPFFKLIRVFQKFQKMKNFSSI